MNCPNCPDQTLLLSDRQGVEIDYCAQCRGVWLDRGELDKLIERSAAREHARPTGGDAGARRPAFVDSDYPGAGSHGHGPRRRKSWLSEFFD